jgi:iron(III) transport system permease protein
MRSLDPAMEDAAGVSGANKFWVFMRISLPLVWPGILGGAIYIFMTAISIFDVPAMLGAAGGKAPVLSSELFYAVHPVIPQSGEIRYGAAGVYAALIAAPSLVALYYYHKVLAKAHSYAVITGKGYRPRDVELGRFKWFGIGFVMTYLLLAMILPLLVLLWISLLPLIQMPSVAALGKLGFVNYYDFWAELYGQYIIRNTLYLVAAVSVLSLFFSFMISWVVVRTDLPGRKTMDTIAMIPHAFPGIAFAFALLMIGIFAARYTPWLPVLGTLGVIVFAEVLNRISYMTRITNAALLQVAPELEHCARLCGAGNIPTMARIVAPLIGPSLLFAALWTALLTFREVSVALMLTQTNNTVLSVAVWRLWTHGHMGQAAAAAVVMTAVMGLLLALGLALSRGQLLHHRPRDVRS